MKAFLSTQFSDQLSSTSFQNDLFFQSTNTTLYLILGVIATLVILGFLSVMATCLDFRKFDNMAKIDF